MEQTIEDQPKITDTPHIPTTEQESTPQLCLTCHQIILPEYYFCPNCGNKLAETPLQVTMWAQTQLYMFSIVLPLICFLTIGRWKGIKYLTSKNKEAHTVGIIACILLIISTVFTFWFTYVSVQKLVRISSGSINENLDAY